MLESTAQTLPDPMAETVMPSPMPPIAASIDVPAVEVPPVPAEELPPVLLDLDAEVQEDRPPPFWFQLQGRRLLLSDPNEVDWQELILALASPVALLRKVMSESDADFFFATRLPLFKMRRLSQQYQEHYGLPAANQT